MVTKIDIVTDFETWIKKNYIPRYENEIPDNFDPSKEIYYRINDKQYGPILLKDIPKKYL